MVRVIMHHRIASKDGQCVHLMEILKAMETLGVSVKMVGPSLFDDAEFGNDGGLASKLKKRLPASVYEVLEFGYSAVVAIRLWRAVKEFKPDFIYERYNLYQPAGVMISKLLKLPICLEVNAPLVMERAKHSQLALSGLASWCEGFTWRNADAVLPVTQVLADKFVSAAGVKKSRIHVVHNGVREQKLVDNECLPTPIKKTGEIILGFAGFAHLTCGLEHVLNFMAEVRDPRIKLVCVGPTEDFSMTDARVETTYKYKVASLGLQEQVSFVGLKNPEQTQELISGFDIALLPSVTEYASPLKIFDYMAAKCLIVAPDSDNIKEILCNYDGDAQGNAILFPAGNEAVGLGAALKRAILLCDSGEASVVGQRAFEAVSEAGFTWEQNVRRILQLMTSARD